MNPFVHAQVRQSSDAEVEALEAVAGRLQGFGADLSLEWMDGFLTALAAGPSVPPVERWLPAISSEQFDRVFADPADHAQALRALKTRLKVLCEQLNPEALLDNVEVLRLSPILMEWSDEDRQKMAEQGELSAEIAQALSTTGGDWALGFADAMEAFVDLWQLPPSTEPGADAAADEEWEQGQAELLDQVMVLMASPDSEAYRTHLTTYYANDPAAGNPSREDLVAEALYAVQDLRLMWLDRAPKPTTRRVEAEPGRNDPCHCGSGKKFKKCHGAAA